MDDPGPSRHGQSLVTVYFLPFLGEYPDGEALPSREMIFLQDFPETVGYQIKPWIPCPKHVVVSFPAVMPELKGKRNPLEITHA